VKAVITGKLPDRVPACLHNYHHAAKEDGASLAGHDALGKRPGVRPGRA
jgi:hypothetical protein